MVENPWLEPQVIRIEMHRLRQPTCAGNQSDENVGRILMGTLVIVFRNEIT